MNEKLFLIVGPSGVGKGTVIDHLKRIYPQFVFPVSYTTREKRPREKDGDVYHFISKEEFKKNIAEDKFLEYARVHSDNFYGTLKEPILTALQKGKNVVREVDIQGFESIKNRIPKENLVSIFLYINNWEDLKGRIMRRHPESEEEIAQREQSFEHEMAKRFLCDYQVESREGDIEGCVTEVEEIVKRSLL